MHIVVVGGGMAGLGTALACARDGHRVTILERDATPMPESADAAFSWERRGAPQVRHSHAFLARSRQPAARSRARRARRVVRGGRDRDPVHCDAAADPDRQDPTAGRRRARRARVPAHDVRMGVAPRRARRTRRRTPRRRRRRRPRRGPGIAAARDGRGRDRRPTSWSTRAARARPRMPWLAAIGAAAVPEELHESGIVYFSRFYRVQPRRRRAAGRRTRPRSISAT